MLNIITIPGINKDKVTAVNINHCHQLLPRDVSGLFVINLKTKQFVYCKSSSPYAYASEIRKSYKKASTTVQEFINKVYRPTAPLYNPLTELEAPAPTHIEVCYQDKTVFMPIANYNQEVIFPVTVNKLSNVEIVFYKETVTGYLKLSVASMLVR